jgi:hypothetical protein
MRMKNPDTRLMIYSTLMTVGVALMLIGITWLMFFGIALVVLAAYFSSQRWTGSRHVVAFIVCAAVTVIEFVRQLDHKDVFAKQNVPLWLWITLGVIWLWAVLGEFYKWRKTRSTT